MSNKKSPSPPVRKRWPAKASPGCEDLPAVWGDQTSSSVMSNKKSPSPPVRKRWPAKASPGHEDLPAVWGDQMMEASSSGVEYVSCVLNAPFDDVEEVEEISLPPVSVGAQDAKCEVEAEVEYDLVEKLTEDQVCSICTKVLNQPHLINCCEQEYCEDCLEKWLEENDTCPHCRSSDFSHILLKQKSRKLGELKVYCPNKKCGCETILKINEYNSHLSETNDGGCPYVKIRCPNRCYSRVLRVEMKVHLLEQCPKREAKCIFCEKVGEYRDIAGNHVFSCPMYPLDCPQGCGVSVVRKDLATHRDTCPLETVPCPYRELGCKVQVPRKNLEKHVESSVVQHMGEMAKSLLSLKEEHETLKRSHKAVGEVLKTLPPVLSEGLQVAQIQTLLSDCSKAELNETLYLTLSESNKKAGQHFFTLGTTHFKLQWEVLDPLGQPFYAKFGYEFKLFAKVPGIIEACDVEICVVPYQRQKRSYTTLAKVCCFNDMPTSESFQLLNTIEHPSKDGRDNQIGVMFTRHKARDCSCTCHKIAKKKFFKAGDYVM